MLVLGPRCFCETADLERLQLEASGSVVTVHGLVYGQLVASLFGMPIAGATVIDF